MFPVRESRLRSALRRSLDAAIEFATLGEYGWSPAWDGPGTPPAASARPAEPAGSRPAATATADADAPTALLVRPASAAGRSGRNAQARGAPRCGGQPLLGRALDSQLPRTARSRDGMAPRDQRCLSRPAA